MIRSAIPASQYDVVVVGARCAGAATAMLLARAGHRVLVVDRGRYGTDTLSTHALMRGAVVQLHRWNILPAVITADTTPIRQATFFYGDESVSIPIPPRDGIDALFAPRRFVLDRLLVDAAGAAGADIVHGVRIKGLQRAATGPVIGVVLEDESGHLHEVASDIVVGADGMRSTVARLVDAQTYRAGRHATATVYGHWPGLDVAGYEWYFVPGLSAGAIPTNAGEVCVSLTVPGPEFTRLFAHRTDETFGALLSEVAPTLAERVASAGPRPLQGFPGHAGFFRQSHGPGWALVGDAGYFKDPLTAHGITDALRDAELLTAAILAGSDEALAGYQEQRDAASLDVFEATDAIASFGWTLSRLRPLHEALAKAMSREVKLLVGA
ncbi:MAG TPA: NAD(P)/FAD-dependent oxidoreductase [Vicinamibacterales bacterium]|nr:NAD(P)/FAD-dependent oxidoreductase [Vicinamibacterales bacterium]